MPTPGATDGADVLVVGGGIAGATLHYELSRRGVNSLLLERSRDGAGGASGVPAALLNPHRGRSGRAHTADPAGMAAFWQLAAALEADVGTSGAHRSGVLRIADNEKQARAWRRLGGTRWLEPAEVPDAYHAPFGAMLVESGGWAKTSVLLPALLEAAGKHGGRARSGVELLGLTRAGPERGPGGSIVASLAGAGAAATVSARVVVLAVGAWQLERLRLPRFELNWGEARVLELGSTPPYPLAGSVVAAFEEGRALVSGGHRNVDRVGEPVPQEDAGASALQRALAWQLPAAADAPEAARWHGVRAKRPSAEPVARRLAPGVYFLGAFGGRGFLRAAELSARLAERIAATL